MKFTITRYLILFSFTLFISGNAFAQASLKKADRYFHDFDYALALAEYKKLLDDKEPSLYLTQRIADCHRLMNNPKEAEFWYSQALAFPESPAINTFHYAESARQNGHYLKAKQLYQKYGQMVHGQEELLRKPLAACDLALEWMASPVTILVQKATELNSSGSDFSPTAFQEGILVTSDRPRKNGKGQDIYGWTGNPYLQLYFAKKETDSTYSAPEPLEAAINTAFHNGVATVSADQKTLYFTRTNRVKQKNKNINTDPTSWVKKQKPDRYVNRLEIFTAEWKDGKWTNVKPFPYNNALEYSVGHPALSVDGNVLYFVSDMPGSLGETDIYYCEKQQDGTWGNPVNLGSTINTSSREMFPSVAPTGTFYFSSDGHLGMGGLDVFSAQGSKDSWTNVQNMRYPFNSYRDDFGVMYNPDGETGFLSSNRDSENGTDDIYRFERIRIKCTVAGRTIEKVRGKDNKLVEQPVSKVLLSLYRGNDTAAVRMYSDANGQFSFDVEEGVTYNIKGTKPGYLTKSASITPDCKSIVEVVKLDIPFHKSTPNKPMVVENIYYDLDKYDIRPDAAKELDKLVQLLNDNPSIRIELSSHTDSRQTNHYNLMLSQLRAEAAVKYIVTQGISIDRITAKGYGETQLLNRCKDGVRCSEEEHQLNRRTEFKIIR